MATLRCCPSKNILRLASPWSQYCMDFCFVSFESLIMLSWATNELSILLFVQNNEVFRERDLQLEVFAILRWDRWRHIYLPKTLYWNALPWMQLFSCHKFMSTLLYPEAEKTQLLYNSIPDTNSTMKKVKSIYIYLVTLLFIVVFKKSLHSLMNVSTFIGVELHWGLSWEDAV